MTTLRTARNVAMDDIHGPLTREEFKAWLDKMEEDGSVLKLARDILNEWPEG